MEFVEVTVTILKAIVYFLKAMEQNVEKYIRHIISDASAEIDATNFTQALVEKYTLEHMYMRRF